jgi:ribosomal protein L37AE/L43A
MGTALKTELTEENKNDVFTCTYCKKSTTRGEIRKIWNVIPFGTEEDKTYYCGCFGWD